VTIARRAYVEQLAATQPVEPIALFTEHVIGDRDGGVQGTIADHLMDLVDVVLDVHQKILRRRVKMVRAGCAGDP